MTKNHKARASRVLTAAALATLVSAAGGAAFAAPSASAVAAAANAERDAKIADLQRNFDALTAQLAQLRSEAATKGESDSRLAAFQAALDAYGKQLADLNTAQQADAANIATLQLPPIGGATTTTIPNGKPQLATADGRFTANFHSVMQFDTSKYFQDHDPAAVDLNSGTNFRRARLGLEGKLFGDFDYGVVYEFGGSGAEDTGHIHEMWAQYTGIKPFRIKVGAFEPTIGMDANVSTGSIAFLERAAPAEVARGVAAGDSRSALQITTNNVIGDAGVQAYWMVSGAVTGNVVTTLNSTAAAGAQPFGEQLAYIGRATIAPFSGANWMLHFGVNGQYVEHANDAGGPDVGTGTRYPIQFRDRPELRTDGTRLIDTGAIDARHAWVTGLEAAAQTHNLLVQGEYFKYGVDRRNSTLSDPDFDGWYVMGSWVLTGENRRYNQANGAFDGPAPNLPFGPGSGAWGAWELAARYSDLDLNYHAGAAGAAPPADGIRGGEQKIGTIGINWYLNSTIRFMLDYQDVKIDRLSPSAASFSTPVGAQIGQHYQALTLRSQVQF